jgi:hypothetical protein
MKPGEKGEKTSQTSGFRGVAVLFSSYGKM